MNLAEKHTWEQFKRKLPNQRNRDKAGTSDGFKTPKLFEEIKRLTTEGKRTWSPLQCQNIQDFAECRI